jgi:hypothetical protein
MQDPSEKCDEQLLERVVNATRAHREGCLGCISLSSFIPRALKRRSRVAASIRGQSGCSSQFLYYPTSPGLTVCFFTPPVIPQIRFIPTAGLEARARTVRIRNSLVGTARRSQSHLSPAVPTREHFPTESALHGQCSIRTSCLRGGRPHHASQRCAAPVALLHP